MDGWPNRAGRMNFTTGGVDLEDERAITDPRTQVGAYQFKLLWWQLGALGLASPKATFVYRPAPLTELLTFGAFSWDEVVYENIIPANYPSFFAAALNATGDYTFTFPKQVLGRPDENGVQQLESFSLVGANARAANTWGGVGAFSALASAELAEQVSTWTVRVRIRDLVAGAAGNSDVLVRLF